MADNRHQEAMFLVGNIPAGYHSSDLRNYFKDFIEKRAFTCFHFKHRPEHERRKQDGNQQPAEKGISDQAVSDANTPLYSHSPSSTTTTEQSSDLLKTSTCCCVVKVKDGFTDEFIKCYHGKRWTNQNGDQLGGQKVRILLLNISAEGLTENEVDRREGHPLINPGDLESLPELNPPHLMPHGNVGTPLGVFMDLIRNCKLPSHVIKKLKLNFPISKSKKGYKAVPMKYGVPVNVDTNTLTHRDIAKSLSLDQWRDNDKDCPPERKKPRMTPDEVNSENNEIIPKDDDYDAEEWERYEALHEDVDKQGRTSERLFENEMEVVWDKGSSGLVFYTDASHWDQQDGDFDEKCSKEDDWDVDMSLYYGYSSTDRSGVELRQMATERSLREGQSTEEGDEVNQHAWNGGKGFGGKILKQKGWREGSGLGIDGGGISEPLEPEGQHPTCKKGLGYHGERIPTPYHHNSGNKGKMKTKDTLISTIYDDPVEEEERPSRRAAPTTLKYRQSHIDKHKGTENNNK